MSVRSTWLTALIALSSLIGGCNSMCENPDLADLQKLCEVPDPLWITDFELGENPTAAGGSLAPWKDSLSNVQVKVCYATEGGGSNNSRFYARVDIFGNNGDSPAGWSGGGINLSFSSKDYQGHDLTPYEFLVFDLKFFPGNHLDESEIKLEDISSQDQVRFPLSSLNLDLAGQWQTVRIPLSAFTKTFNTSTALDAEHTIRLVTISVHDGHRVQDVDGSMGIDNVRFER